MSTRKLLIVDDDEGLRRQLQWAFDNCRVVVAKDRPSAMAAIKENVPPVVLLDLGLPPDPHGPSEGLATLESVLAAAPATKVIVMTGQTEREYAVQAIARGAYDFYQKPIEITTLNLIVQRAYNLYDLEEENRELAGGAQYAPLPGFLTANPQMLRVCEDVHRWASANVTVLLLGESGTGKEVVARALHELSSRARQPFVAINCAAIPEQLLESELFGHEKGAFTGAVKTIVGKTEQADKGTLFLDEIGDMPLPLQAKLFRFIQERAIERVGGRVSISVDIRLICATNKNLSEMIEHGQFRIELYYRISEAVVNIIPLRDRPEDIPLIATFLLHKVARAQGRNVHSFTAQALVALCAYSWPGNVRELENRIKRAVVSARTATITINDLDLAPASQADMTLRAAREKADRSAIAKALAEAAGNISKTAKILDISRPTLYQLLKDYGIKIQQFNPESA